MIKIFCEKHNINIAKRHPLVEVFTGVIFVITFIMNGVNVTSTVLCVYALILIAIGWTDWMTMTIPNRLIKMLLVCAVPLIFLQMDIMIWERIVGFFIISIPMLIITVIKPESFGGGDIKLMAVNGLILGYKNTVVAAILGIFICGAYIIYLLVRRKVSRKSNIPLGPGLCMGSYIAALIGDVIVQWYYYI